MSRWLNQKLRMTLYAGNEVVAHQVYDGGWETEIGDHQSISKNLNDIVFQLVAVNKTVTRFSLHREEDGAMLFSGTLSSPIYTAPGVSCNFPSGAVAIHEENGVAFTADEASNKKEPYNNPKRRPRFTED